MLPNNSRRNLDFCRGFVLVSVLSVAMILLLVALLMLSLATIETKSESETFYRDQARSNARMALMIAVGKLQGYAGPDQRVTARGDLLNDGCDKNKGGWNTFNKPNRCKNWLGVWKTTFNDTHHEWPLIGKGGRNTPYQYPDIYTDLRETQKKLRGGVWKQELFLGWLVSQRGGKDDKGEHAGVTRPCGNAIESDHVVELVGRGSFLGDVQLSDYENGRVLVDKIDISSSDSTPPGAYAWYISDNNQKARLGDGKIVSVKSLELVKEGDGAWEDGCVSKEHDVTTENRGLLVDVCLGGLKKDLTPLLFAKHEKAIVTFHAPKNARGKREFSSDDPIIPGGSHAVLGPSFGALRSWGRLRFLSRESSGGGIMAQVPFSREGNMRVRPVDSWAYHYKKHGREVRLSDGLTFDGGKWASLVPKVFPVMVDARWHYYFSYSSGETAHLRSHIIPRVCLWNPYSVAMKTQKLLVLMPNPFQQKNGFHFVVDEAEARRMKEKFQDSRDLKLWGRCSTSGSHVGPFKIQAKGGEVLGGRNDLFPDSRYLAFVLDPAYFAPGECLVFSPILSSADHQSMGVGIQKYDVKHIERNRLSAKSPQGEDHFFWDYEGGLKFQVQWKVNSVASRLENKNANVGFRLITQMVKTGGDTIIKKGWRSMSQDMVSELKLSEIKSYEPWMVVFDNFPFILKSVDAPLNRTAESVVSENPKHFPTLQLLNHGNGGVSTSSYWYYAPWWGSSRTASNGRFGYLETFRDAPLKDAPALHQFGAKLMWFDESLTEANSPPLRCSLWQPDHVVYHPAIVAEWNVRASLATRSPASPCASKWYTNSLGAWIQQFAPFSPRDIHDMPVKNSRGYYKKPPMGYVAQRGGWRDVVMFDLPSKGQKVLSLAQLRHALISPYSWHPTYVIASSLVDLHAPFQASAWSSLSGPYQGREKSAWDVSIGGSRPYRLAYGPSTYGVNSSGLLQIGECATHKKVAGKRVSSKDEILAYDIAFEVNQNLWDAYFLSGVSIDNGGFQIKSDDINGVNYHACLPGGWRRFTDRLNQEGGWELGFWENAHCLYRKGVFNVNSTSEFAWRKFLEKSLTNQCKRVRSLTKEEINRLAHEMVVEVKRRGPFISMADFVNRRLRKKTEPYHKDAPEACGAMDAAIIRADINHKYEQFPYLTAWNDAYDYNRDEEGAHWKFDVDKQPKSKAWGMPGYITQGELLESLGASMSVRGDSFTVRAYGEARDRSGKIRAVAYLEAVVLRSTEYVERKSLKGGNTALDAALLINRRTGELSDGPLTATNRKFGRRFYIQSFRWLSPREI